VNALKDYKALSEELMVLLQSMAATSGGRIGCAGETLDRFSLTLDGEEIGNALSTYRALLIIFDGSPLEMAKCFYTELLLPVKKAGIIKSYDVGVKWFESVLGLLWGDQLLANQHLKKLIEDYS